jgi:hypothetical protein
VDHKTIEAGVGDDQIATSPQNEDGNAPLTSKCNGIKKIIFGADFGEVTRWSSNA